MPVGYINSLQIRNTSVEVHTHLRLLVCLSLYDLFKVLVAIHSCVKDDFLWWGLKDFVEKLTEFCPKIFKEAYVILFF